MDAIIVGEAEYLIRPVGGAAFAAEADATSKAGFSKVEANAAASGQRSGEALKKGLAVGAVVWAALGAGAIDAASKYQSATASIAANADIPISKAQAISKAFLGTMGTSIYSANTIANAYAPVSGQLGAVEGHALTAGQALTVMSAAGNLAEATGGQLASTTADLSGVMQAYHLTVGQAAAATDVLFGTSRVTGVGVDTLASEFERLHSRLGDLTPSLAESGGLLNALAKSGVTGRTSMSALNGAFTTLLGGSKTTDATIQQLGIHVFNSQGQFVGMKSVISQLQPILSGYNQESQLAITKALFGATANKQLLDVVLQGPAAYQAATDEVAKHGEAQAAAAKQSQTFSHQVDVLKATAVDLGIKLGSVLVPILSTVAHAFLSATGFVTDHKAVLVALSVVIGGVLTAAMGAFVVGKMVAFKNSFLDAKSAVQGLSGYLSGAFKSTLTDTGNDLDTAGGKVTSLGADATATQGTTTTAMTETRSQYALTGSSTTNMAAKAKTASLELGGAEATMVTETAAADTTIETDNAAAGASFTAIIPLVGAAALAISAYNAIVPNFNAKTKANLSSLNAVSGGGALTPAQLKQLDVGVEGANATGTGRREPWADQLNAVVTSLTTAVSEFSKTGKSSSFDQFKSAEAALLKQYDVAPVKSSLDTLNSTMAKAITYADANARARAQAQSQHHTPASTAPGAADRTTAGTKTYTPPVTPAQAAAQAKTESSALFAPITAALQAAEAAKKAEAKAQTQDAKQAAAAIVAEHRKALAVLTADAKAGQTEERNLVVAAHSTTLSQAKTAIDYAHTTAMRDLVVRLDATHQASLEHMASTIEADYRDAQAKEVELARQATLKTDTKAGTGELAKLVTAEHATSLATLRTDLDQTHKTAMQQVVKELRDAHSAPLTKMAGQITTDWKATLAQEATVQSAAQAKTVLAAQTAYDKMETAAATGFSDLADGAATLSKASADLGITASATSTSAINQQLSPLGGVTTANAAAMLTPLIAAFQQGPLSVNSAAGFATQFGGTNSALGVDLTALGSGKLNASQTDAETKATEALIAKMAALVASVDKNTSAVTTSTGALAAIGSGGSVSENIYARSPQSGLAQLDFALNIGALPTR